MKTWNVVELGEGFAPNSEIELSCPHCHTDAKMPFREQPDNPLIAATGLLMVFDRPGLTPEFQIVPKTIKCRTCRRTFTSETR